MAKIRLWIDRIAAHPYGRVLLLTLALYTLARLPGGRELIEAAQVATQLLAPTPVPHQPVAVLR